MDKDVEKLVKGITTKVAGNIAPFMRALHPEQVSSAITVFAAIKAGRVDRAKVVALASTLTDDQRPALVRLLGEEIVAELESFRQ